MNTTNRKIKKYLRQVASLLPCGLKEKKRMLGDLQSRLYDFFESNPEADFSALEEHFGTPQQIAATYVEESGTAELLEKLKLRKRILTIFSTVLISAAVIIVLGFLIMYIIALIDSFAASGAYIVTSPIYE